LENKLFWILNQPFTGKSISLIGLIAGVFLLFKPYSAIKIQIKFYEKINWRIEPISMKREIRNTKIMGIAIILISLVALIFIKKQ